MKIWPIYEITLQYDEMLALSNLLSELPVSKLISLGLTDLEISKIVEIYKQIEPFVPASNK